jgi:hypothetical protein
MSFVFLINSTLLTDLRSYWPKGKGNGLRGSGRIMLPLRNYVLRNYVLFPPTQPRNFPHDSRPIPHDPCPTSYGLTNLRTYRPQGLREDFVPLRPTHHVLRTFRIPQPAYRIPRSPHGSRPPLPPSSSFAPLVRSSYGECIEDTTDFRRHR